MLQRDYHWPAPPYRADRDREIPPSGLKPSRLRVCHYLKGLAKIALTLCPGLDADGDPVPLPEDSPLRGPGSFIAAALRDWMPGALAPDASNLLEWAERETDLCLVTDHKYHPGWWLIPGDIIATHSAHLGIVVRPQCLHCRDIQIASTTPADGPDPVPGAWEQTVWTTNIRHSIRIILPDTPDTPEAPKS